MQSERERGPSRGYIIFIVAMLMCCGVYSSLCVKFAFDFQTCETTNITRHNSSNSSTDSTYVIDAPNNVIKNATNATLDTKVTNCANVFNKPFAFTVFMFWGELLCLGVYWFKTKAASSEERSSESEERTLLIKKEVKSKPPMWNYAILATFDCLATAVTMMGQVSISASLSQMLRGSMIPFTALFTIPLLKRGQSKQQWIAIGVVFVALIVCGLSGAIFPASSESSTSSAADVLLGIFLVLLGSAFNAVQGCLEERLLTGVQYAEVDSSEVVGWEGFFGCFISMFVMLPICQHAPAPLYEDTWDTIDQISKHWQVPVLFMASFAILLCAFNYYCQEVAKYMSAVVRQILNTVKTIFVWAISLIVYYSIDADYGEPWGMGSYIQLAGFCLLVIATRMYIKAPKLQPKDSGIN